MSGLSPTTELEALLQRRLDRDVLVVYADALQAAGDARGELIALDLRLARGATPALLAARQAAAQRWLGEASGAMHWPSCTHELGLLDAALAGDARSSMDDRLDAVQPHARYLRSLTVFGYVRDVRTALTRLAEERLPWLTRLSIDLVGGGGLPRSVVAAFAEAAPHLRALELRGTRVMATPVPASIEKLALHGRSALVIAADAVPGVTELDLIFSVPDAVALRALAPLVNPRSFPDLARLDLARNEPIYPRAHPGNVDAQAFVQAIEAPERLRWLRLPSLRSAEQVTALRGLLEAYPGLEVEVARSYRELAALTAGFAHPRLRIPPPRPWPPGDRLSSRDALFIIAGHAEEQLGLADCVDALELGFDAMPAPARAGWTALWDLLETLPPDDDDATRTVPAAPLLAAVAALPRDARCARATELLRGLPADAEVQVQRERGW